MAIHLCGGCSAEICNSNKGCQTGQTSYVGAVLATYEVNMLNDSDFGAIVYDADSDSLKTVLYGSTAYWTYHNGATVDASPEVEALAERALARWLINFFTVRAQREAREVTPGKRVKSLTTRGKAKDVYGSVVRVEQSQFNRHAKVAVIDADNKPGLFYVDVNRVEVIESEPIDPDEIRRTAERTATRRNWHDIRSLLF